MTIVAFAIRGQMRPVETGAEAIIGRLGEVRSALSPAGMVQVAGELWSAEVEQEGESLQVGTKIEVVGVDGLKLIVRKHGKRPVDSLPPKL
jgi:membrane-bound serine protease (ClpP class)